MSQLQDNVEIPEASREKESSTTHDQNSTMLLKDKSKSEKEVCQSLPNHNRKLFSFWIPYQAKLPQGKHRKNNGIFRHANSMLMVGGLHAKVEEWPPKGSVGGQACGTQAPGAKRCHEGPSTRAKITELYPVAGEQACPDLSYPGTGISQEKNQSWFQNITLRGDAFRKLRCFLEN